MLPRQQRGVKDPETFLLLVTPVRKTHNKPSINIKSLYFNRSGFDANVQSPYPIGSRVSTPQCCAVVPLQVLTTTQQCTTTLLSSAVTVF